MEMFFTPHFPQNLPPIKFQRKHFKLFEVNGRTDGRTDGRPDDGEFNSPPSSLRVAGDKNFIIITCIPLFQPKVALSPLTEKRTSQLDLDNLERKLAKKGLIDLFNEVMEE